MTRKVNNQPFFNDRMQQRICDLKGNGRMESQGNFRYLVLSYLRLEPEGISDFEGNRPRNHQNSLKSRPGNNKGIKYHRWLYLFVIYYNNTYIIAEVMKEHV